MIVKRPKILKTNSLETRIEKMQEMFNKVPGEILKSQSIMDNVINRIKNTLEETNSRIMQEERISEEDIMVEINETERKKRIKRNKHNLRDLWNNVKHPNIRIIVVPEKEDKKRGHEKILEEIIV